MSISDKPKCQICGISLEGLADDCLKIACDDTITYNSSWDKIKKLVSKTVEACDLLELEAKGRCVKHKDVK